MELPRFFSVKAAMKYLSYINGDDDQGVKVRGLLKFSGEEVVSHLTKFEIEKAEGGLVHIKSCYNNKYWQRLSEKDGLIVAGGNEKEEDTSKWSCTLFKLNHVSTIMFQFYHVQLRQHVIYYSPNMRGSGWYDYCLTTEYNNAFYLGIIDWATLVILPKHVAFKGENHKYAKALPLKNQRYLQFSADKIISDHTVEHEIFHHNSGSSIRIKNTYTKQFWKRNHKDWITIDAAEDSSINDKDTLFSPIIIDNNVIALHNEGNTKVCNVVTTKELKDCLSAADPTFYSCPRLEVVDLVSSCRIIDVDYHLMDERIYDQTILTVASGYAENNTEETVDMDVKLSYTDVMTWSMSSNVASSKLGYKVEVTASIPKIADANAKIAGNFSGKYSWGKTVEMKSRMEVVYLARVPPMTKVEVKLIASKGSCDIPFSYTQEDVLKNRRTVTDNMHDGIYTCSNCFNFNYETSEEPYEED